MELLNQNQRRSALIRILVVGILTLAVATVIIARIHKEYAGMGQEELRICQENFELEIAKLKGINLDLVSKNNKLEKELKDCRESKNDPNERVQLCEDRIKAKDDEIESLDRKIQGLERDIQRCESKLQSLNSLN